MSDETNEEPAAGPEDMAGGASSAPATEERVDLTDMVSRAEAGRMLRVEDSVIDTIISRGILVPDGHNPECFYRSKIERLAKQRAQNVERRRGTQQPVQQKRPKRQRGK